MSRLLYLDAASGASGDMLLGTMVEQGASFPGILRALKGLKGLPGSRRSWAGPTGMGSRHGESK